MARALLQNADVVILDESFAALDPETLQLAMRCALQRARTLLLIAHPRRCAERARVFEHGTATTWW